MNREEKKIRTREAIISAAIKLFSEKGFEATTVEEIAKEAGVAKGTFFNYFKTKEAVVDEFERFSIFFEMNQLNSQNQIGPIAPRIISAIINLLQKVNYTRSLRRATLQATLSSTRYLEQHQESIQKFNELLVPLFQVGQERGEFTKRIPPQTLADLTIQMFIGVLTHWCLGGGQDDLTTQIVLSFEVFFNGISKT